LDLRVKHFLVLVFINALDLFIVVVTLLQLCESVMSDFLSLSDGGKVSLLVCLRRLIPLENLPSDLLRVTISSSLVALGSGLSFTGGSIELG
jgi:hypothetical protein